MRRQPIITPSSARPSPSGRGFFSSPCWRVLRR